MAAVNLSHAPIRALSNPHLLETERVACWIHMKKEEGEGEERESVVEFPPDAPGSSLDDALWIPSDDDDDDDGFPPLSEILDSNAPGAPREPGLPVTPGNSGGREASPDDAPRQANVDDVARRDGAVESSPKTQGTSTDTAIVIPEAEEEEDCQLDLVCPPPLESNASSVLGGEPGVNSAGIPDRGTPEDPTSAVERDFMSGHGMLVKRMPKTYSLHLSSTLVSSHHIPHEDGDNGADDADTTDRQDTAETSATECDTPVQLPSPPTYKSPLSPCGRRAAAVHRVCDRAQEDRGETMPPQRRLLRQDSDSGDDKSTRVLGKVGDEDEDYNPSHTEAARPQRKRRKISTLSRHVQERLISDDSSEGGTAADTVQATYDEWPLQDALLKRVTEGGRTVFQLQFAWDSRPQHHPKAYGGRTASAREPGVSGAKFTEDEDALLIRLKEDDCLRWAEIHERFSKQFRGRSRGALQVRYSTKLKGRK